MRDQTARYFRYFTYIKPVAKMPLVRTYGSTIFTLFIMTIFIFFAIKPTVETIIVLQKKLENFDTVLQNVQEKANDLTLAKQNYQNLDQSIKNKIQASVPDNLQLRSVIQTLEGSAQKFEASVSALQIQPQTLVAKDENKIGSIGEVPFTFNVEGSYKNLISILSDLQKSSRLISIDALSITRVTEGGGLVMSIQGKVYYLK